MNILHYSINKILISITLTILTCYRSCINTFVQPITKYFNFRKNETNKNYKIVFIKLGTHYNN